MHALAEHLLNELRSASYCPVYEEQLRRLWPINDSNREAKIRSFAEERGLRLRFYCEGQCAVFLISSARTASDYAVDPDTCPCRYTELSLPPRGSPVALAGFAELRRERSGLESPPVSENVAAELAGAEMMIDLGAVAPTGSD